MLETVILLSFCFLMGLLSLAIVVWIALSGRMFYLDGLLFAVISLAVGGIFLANFAFSVLRGEFQSALKSLLKSPDDVPRDSAPPST